MILQDKIDIFINKAQSKIAKLSHNTALDLDESYISSSDMQLVGELIDVIGSLQDELLDWSDYDKEFVIDYYTIKAELNNIAVVNFTDKNNIFQDSDSDNSWVPAYNALNAKVDQNKVETDAEIIRLDARIDNLDFSNLIPQEVLDEIDANTAARHTHANKPILDSITQADLDAISSNTSHRNDGTIHVTNVQKQSWDAKVSQQELTSGLATKADAVHTHEIADVNGLTEALDGLEPEKGDPGDPGITPLLQAGTVEDGAFDSEIDNTDPAFPILNLTIPAGQDGEDFHIDVYGNASDRLNSIYDAEPEGFSLLGLDNGNLYFRRPLGDNGDSIPATSTAGWYSTKFMGDNGWSPILGVSIISDTKTALTLVGWTGGEGDQPSFGTPGQTTYLGVNGFTQDANQAINIKGNTGEQGVIGKAVFPDAQGNLVGRDAYDGEVKDFMYYDSETGLMYIKRSDTSADWSSGYQWRGDQGPQGEQGDDGTGGGLPTGEQGDIIYHDGTDWVVLSAGTAGQLLSTGGNGANPSWTDASSGSASPEWALNSFTAWDGDSANYVPDMSLSDVDELLIDDTADTLVFDNPTSQAVAIGRKKYIVVDNSANTSAISTITFGTDYSFAYGVRPNGIAAGAIVTFELFNNLNSLRCDFSIDE